MSIYGQYDLRGILGDQTGEDFIETLFLKI